MSKEQQQHSKGFFKDSVAVPSLSASKGESNRYRHSGFNSFSIMRFAGGAFFYPVLSLVASGSALRAEPILDAYPASLQRFLTVQGKLPGTGSVFLERLEASGNRPSGRWDYMQLTAHPQQGSERRRAEVVLGQRFAFSDTAGVLSGFWYQSGWLQSATATRSRLQKTMGFRRGSIGLLSKWGYLEWECDRSNANWIAPNERGVAVFSQHLKWGGVSLGHGHITRGRDHCWQLAARVKQNVSPSQSVRLAFLRSASRDEGVTKADWRLIWRKLGQQGHASQQGLWDESIEDRLCSIFDYGSLGTDPEREEQRQPQEGEGSEGIRGTRISVHRYS